MVIQKLIFEEILNSLIRNHTLIKYISASLGALNHLDYLCVCTSVS